MLTGGCLCKQFRYEVAAAPFSSAICHCTTCQHAHGAPMVAFFSAKLADFRKVSGDLADYASSDHAVRRFCGTCGTHVLFDDSRYPDEVDIATATLDDAAAAPPSFHIWTRSKLDWVRLADDLPAFAERSGS